MSTEQPYERLESGLTYSFCVIAILVLGGVAWSYKAFSFWSAMSVVLGSLAVSWALAHLIVKIVKHVRER
jgi:hypothetical protein